MEYTPQITEKYILFAARRRECPICKKIMVKKLSNDYSETSLFPLWRNMNQDAQMKRAGIVFIGSVKVDDEYVCTECEELGKTDFKCELCGERKSTEKIQERFGDPAEFLCKDCYEITAAKLWDEKCDKLEDEHKYDFE